MLLFFNVAYWHLFLYSILSLVSFFCMELPFCPRFILCLLYLWVSCSMLSLMLLLVLLLVVPEAFFELTLVCTILVVQLNKIFSFITQTIKILHGIYCMVYKNVCFCCDTKSKFAPGLHGGTIKISCLSYPIRGLFNSQ